MNNRVTSQEVADQFAKAIKLLLDWYRQEILVSSQGRSQAEKENVTTQTLPERDQLLKPGEVAEMLQLSRSKAYQLMQQGEIPIPGCLPEGLSESSLRGFCTAKTLIASCDIWREITIAIRQADNIPRIPPTTWFHHPVSAGFRSGWIFVRRDAVIILGIPITGIFPYIADHIHHAVG